MKQPPPHVPKLALRPGEAAQALSVSDEFFDRYIAPELRSVRRGSLKFYPVSEIQRWLEENASLVLGEGL